VYDTEALSQRLLVVGVARSSATQIVSIFERWLKNNGAEATCKRIKEMKVNLLRHYAGLPFILPSQENKNSWVKYREKGPKGPLGLLFRLSKENFLTAWNAIMIYTSLVYHDPEVWATKEQWDNLIASVTREPVDPINLQMGLALAHKSPLKVRVILKETTGDSLIDYQTRDTKRAPQVTNDKTALETETVIDSLAVLWHRTVWAVENWDILSGTVKGLEALVADEMELNLIDEAKSGPPLEERPLMGKLSLIQEAGFKLRFAANPHRVYQAALAPLGRALFRALETVPQDCTFDHEKGVRLVQGWLQDSYPAVSMDLSNATDRAPLDLQMEFLSRCGVGTRWLQFLKSTCRGDWTVNNSKVNRYQARTIRWTVGSPLGLYPTFAAFALWHHSVIQAAFCECGWDPARNREFPYVILGDDVVIMDYEVASLVRGWFLGWGMKVADHKSLQSDSVAEFAGRIIRSSDVIRGFKWKGPATDESFIAFARQLGPRSLLIMRPRHKRVLAYIGDLPDPIGLGWNPFGIPLEERLTPLIERVWERDERYRSFSSRTSRANTLLYSSQLVRDWKRWGSKEQSLLVETSDQEVEAVVSAMLPGLGKLGSGIWPNLPLVALERGVPEQVLSWYRAMLKRYSYLETAKDASTLVVIERKIRAILSRSWGRLPGMPGKRNHGGIPPN
jgi:hypothetical protein